MHRLWHCRSGRASDHATEGVSVCVRGGWGGRCPQFPPSRHHGGRVYVRACFPVAFEAHVHTRRLQGEAFASLAVNIICFGLVAAVSVVELTRHTDRMKALTKLVR
jgi:hypothetical protein